ncbi:MAG: gliding motility-associated protein GldM [Gammaproteobacteria bacterium]|jgi:gliding motility-associated protein GldM
MSIPKEPRQLLINLMYIVLTALLALNVSAEIMNAFLLMDKSLNESSSITANSNDKLIAEINKQAETYTQFSELKDKALEAKNISKRFSDFVALIKSDLVEQSGGFDEKGDPKGFKNKDVTTRMLVKDGRGTDLEERIEKTRNDLLGLVAEEDERRILENNIPLRVNEVPEHSDKENWSQYTFQQMPVAAVLPVLSKLQNDVKVAETTILNHFLAKTGITYKPDAFEAVVSANKSYVIRGEQLQAEVFLGSYSSTVDNISVAVNGRNYPVRNGKAIINVSPDGIGKKELNAKITMENPLTGQVESYSKTFVYEVGERSVTASAEKMNVFYVGVDNPLSISAAGVPSAQVNVKADGLHITKVNNVQYNVKPDRPGRTTISVSGGGLEVTTFEFRIKPIPDPVMKLGNKKGGPITPGELRVYNKLSAVLENFDFDAVCGVKGFEVTRVPKNGDAIYHTNISGKFDSDTKRILSKSKPRDTVYFEKIKVKCPGDKVNRSISSLMFRVR